MPRGSRARKIFASVFLLLGLISAALAPVFYPGYVMHLYSIVPFAALLGMCVVCIVIGAFLSRLDGKGERGLWFGCASVGAFVCSAMLAPLWLEMGPPRNPAACLSNIKQIAMGVLMYATDHDDRLPVASNWMDASLRYLTNEQLLWAPGVGVERRWTYAMNRAMSGADLAKVANAERAVLLYDWLGGVRNFSGGLPTFQARHDGRGCIAAANGRAMFRTLEQASALIWSSR